MTARRQTEASITRAIQAAKNAGLEIGEIIIDGPTIRILPKPATTPKADDRKPQPW